MRESSKAALSGIICALSVVIMMTTYISPLLVYTAPPIAGLLLIIIINEINTKWAVGTYFAVSLLSVFLIADKESSVFFTLFFGFFPIASTLIDKKIRKKIVAFVMKFLIFNVSCAISLTVCIYVLGVDYEDIFGDGMALAVVFIVLFEILFLVYNVLVSKLHQLYVMKFSKRVRKMFNIK